MLSDGDFVDRPATRADDWAGIIRGIDARLGAAVDQDSDDVGGGLEQARHPGPEIDRPLLPDTISADPLGLGEDADAVAADPRAMDQSRALGTARTVSALDSTDPRPGDSQLEPRTWSTTPTHIFLSPTR